MYQIKPRRTGKMLIITITISCVVAIGAGVGYAGVKLYTAPKQDNYIISYTPIPTLVPPEETSAAVLSNIPSEEKNTTKPVYFKYLVKLDGNKTNVYILSENGDPVLSHTLPIELGSLRKEDVKKLEEGIYLESKQDLLSFTEDFCS